MTTYEDIRYEVAEGIATITIDRPAVKNAFREQTVSELLEAITRADEDDGIYTLILTGADDAFCAGADVTEMPDWPEMGKEAYGAFLEDVQGIVSALHRNDTPSIAAVDGPAVGAGCDFALACDVRIIGPDALFKEGFVSVGLVPGDGGAWLLPRLIGDGVARELLLTGDAVRAEEAVELGLGRRVVDDTEQAAPDVATSIRDNPRIAVERTKSLLGEQGSFEAHCSSAIEYQWECVTDPEHEEAVAAFRERREPAYDREYE